MPVTSTQDFSFKLVANGTQLDLFKDEAILLSDNVTGLFDLGILPSDFTRQITLPGTKINNAFFEHVYDISIESPFLFETNVKVPCFFDFDSIYLADGYLQLNKVNVIANKFIDSYEVTIYGGLSSFARDINRVYLTDLTSSLAQYNHTASLQNITASWEGNLFGGDIVYPLADYGHVFEYSPETQILGIDSPQGAITVQQFKPSIRLKAVWDAIFEQFGYTYTSSFMEESFVSNIYLVCNNALKFPIFQDIDLETYGLCKFAPLSGSGQTDLFLTSGSDNALPWFKIDSNPGGNLSSQLDYTIDFNSKLRGDLRLNFEISSSAVVGNGVPQFDLVIKSTTTSSISPLTEINQIMDQVYNYNNTQTRTQVFTLNTQWASQVLPSGSYTFNIRYNAFGDNNFSIFLNPNGSTDSYLSVTAVNQGGDGDVMNIANNMPFGTTGIKLIDFITAVQRKFNLVIYPSKTKQREFVVETFNNWYKRGKVKDFNQYINLDEMIEVIPANNLAVNELNFGDTLDKDYVSQEFNNLANREYGKTYFVDTQNFFSQGKFEVQSGFSSSPLVPIPGTGASGSVFEKATTFISDAEATSAVQTVASATSTIRIGTTVVTDALAFARRVGETVQNVDTEVRTIQAGNQLFFEASGEADSVSYVFEKETDSGTTTLASGTGDRTFIYNISVADTTSTLLEFRNIVQSETF